MTPDDVPDEVYDKIVENVSTPETEQAISELVAGDSAPVDAEHASRLWLPGQSHPLETECNELWANSPELRERFNSKKTNFRASFIQDPDSFRD